MNHVLHWLGFVVGLVVLLPLMIVMIVVIAVHVAFIVMKWISSMGLEHMTGPVFDFTQQLRDRMERWRR